MRKAWILRSLAALLLISAGAGAAFAQGLPSLTAEIAQPAVKEGPLPPTNALDKNDLAFYVRHLYAYDDRLTISVGDPVASELPGLLKVTVTASYQTAKRDHEFLVSQDGRHLIEGSTYEIDKNPFHEINETIDTMPAPAFGKEGASVVLVAYSDFQCPFCAKEALVLRNQLQNEYGDRVRVYFKDFPLAMHPWAMNGAIAGRCVYQQEPETFWAYHDWIFENQKSITPENLSAKVGEFVASKGLDTLAFTQCIGDPATATKVEASMEEGREVGVQSTPTLFVNGRRLGGAVEWDQLKAIVDFELEYQEVTHNAGDDCGCSAEIAFPQ